VYQQGASAPIVTYTGDLTFPIGVAVDSKGNMFVANECDATCEGPGDVVEFAPGNPVPVNILHNPAFMDLRSIAVDAHDDLFVTTNASGGGRVVEFPHGSSNGSALRAHLLEPSGMAFDSAGRLLIADPTKGYGLGDIEVFQLDRRRPSRSFARIGSLMQIGFDSTQTLVYAADQMNNLLEVYSYPQGKLLNVFAQEMSGPAGVAVFPPAPY
jgi:hypothetical protein